MPRLCLTLQNMQTSTHPNKSMDLCIISNQPLELRIDYFTVTRSILLLIQWKSIFSALSAATFSEDKSGTVFFSCCTSGSLQRCD